MEVGIRSQLAAICDLRILRIFRNMSLATTIFWILAGVQNTVFSRVDVDVE